jgi:antitoxin (DNA-binding transcriptional repressor) of toxin-antitoxin stability system
MAVLHIDVSDLSVAFDDALTRARAGDEVYIERDGEVVARVVPCAGPGEVKKGDLRAFLEERMKNPPPNEDFARDVAEVHAWHNRRLEPTRWEQ